MQNSWNYSVCNPELAQNNCCCKLINKKKTFSLFIHSILLQCLANASFRSPNSFISGFIVPNISFYLFYCISPSSSLSLYKYLLSFIVYANILHPSSLNFLRCPDYNHLSCFIVLITLLNLFFLYFFYSLSYPFCKLYS